MIGFRIALSTALALIVSTPGTTADGGGVRTTTFVDGLWQGGTEAGPAGQGSGCWASMTVTDGTTLTLAGRSGGDWHLQLSNPGWQLPSPHRYDMVAQIDFYPKRRITAQATNHTLLDIGDLERIALLDLIENGHAIDLIADGFNHKYTLEGSAKIIQRIRACAATAP